MHARRACIVSTSSLLNFQPLHNLYLSISKLANEATVSYLSTEAVTSRNFLEWRIAFVKIRIRALSW